MEIIDKIKWELEVIEIYIDEAEKQYCLLDRNGSGSFITGTIG